MKDHSRTDQSGIQGVGFSCVCRQTISERLLYFWANIKPWNPHTKKWDFSSQPFVYLLYLKIYIFLFLCILIFSCKHVCVKCAFLVPMEARQCI